MTKRVTLTAGVKLKAAANGQGQRRRFGIVAYTGGPLMVDDFEIPIYIDFDGLYWNGSRRPALYNHEAAKENLVGQLDDIRIVAGKLLVDGFFLKSTTCAREVQQIAEDGYEWQASVGADPEQIEEVPEGVTAEVNGRTAEGPCLISRRTCLGEVSFVVMGADDRTSARITARLNRRRQIKALKGRGAMKTFEEFVTELGLDPATLTDQQKTALTVLYNKEYPAVDAEGDDNVDAEGEDNLDAEGEDEELAAEGEEDMNAEGEDKPVAAGRRRPRVQGSRHRVRKISAAARERAKELKRISWIEAACKGHPTIAATALEKGWTLDRTKLEVMRASRPGAPPPQRGGGKLNAKVIEAAMLLTAGVAQKSVGKHYDQTTMNQALERDMRGVGLHYLMDLVIEASGETFRGNRKSDAFINAAKRAERSIRAASTFSTLSMGNILENVANKALISSYEAVETVWQSICGVRSHSDFKIASRVRLDAQGSFRKVGPDGELKHVGLSDAKYTNQLDTFGAILTLTRQMQYNDDLGAFLELPSLLGRMGALSVEEAVFVLLLSNPSNFFHANNRNVAAGVFGIAGLTALEEKFRGQIDSNNKPVLISPQVLLVPTSLKVDADNIYEEVTVNETTTANSAKPARNPHKGKYKPVTTPYLNNENIRVFNENEKAVAIPGQSAVKYYLFANPAERAAIAVAFLNGVQVPTIQTDDTDFNTLGFQWRAFFDFGVGMEDPVAAAQSTGAP